MVGIKQTLGTRQRQNSNVYKSLALQGKHAHHSFPAVFVKIVEPSVQASNRKKNLHPLSSILQNLDIYPTYLQPLSIPGVAVSEICHSIYNIFNLLDNCASSEVSF